MHTEDTAPVLVMSGNDRPLLAAIRPPTIAGWAVLGIAAAVLYTPVFVALVQDWWRNPDYSHGFLIPFAVAYFVGLKRNLLQQLPVRPLGFGLLVIATSQLVYLVGCLGAEFFLQRFSFLLLAAGVVLFLFGWQYLKQLQFPLFLGLLAIPLPAIIFNVIALPLQLLASSVGESLLTACQIPVYRQGNLLQLPTQTLNVAEACSGIRSLVSLITLAAIVAYFLPVKSWVRVLFVLTSIPIALGANAFRVAMTGVLSQFFGERAATGFFHSFSGWVVFMLALGVLLAESGLLRRWVSWRRRVAQEKAI